MAPNINNGFIYPLTRFFVGLLKSINLVEYVKNISARLYSVVQKRKLTQEEIIGAKNFAIDCFMVAKWAFVMIAIAYGFNYLWIEFIVWYLIISNLFTYFYYHVWGSVFVSRDDIDSQRRRYVNFILSLCFYMICYAYLYQYRYPTEIQWPDNIVDTTNALYLSIANAFTLTYGGFNPLSQTARVLFASELINTFFFFTIIVSNSVPSRQK